MLTTVVLTGDTKLAGQIELWMRYVATEKMRTESYSNLDAYKEMLSRSAEVAQSLAVSGAAPKSKDLKQIKLFIVDVDIIPAKPVHWVADLQRITKEIAPSLVEAGIPKVLMMSHDGGVQRPETFQSDGIDDLILKPLDKTLVQQKVEFLVAGEAKISPTFLFRAKTNQIIEVGRDIMIDEISEFAVGVRSPGPLPEGSFASIHADVFGVKGAKRLIGRAYESVKHPVREGEYLVRFSYFGVSPDQLSAIRRYIKSNQTQVRARTWGPPTAPGTQAAAAAPPKPGLSKELQEKMALLKMRKFAVVDMNTDTLIEVKSALEATFKGIVVKPFPSFSRLTSDLRRLLPETAIKQAQTSQAKPKQLSDDALADLMAVEDALPGRRLSMVLRGKTYELVRFDQAMKKSDLIVGKPAGDWLAKPDLFINSIDKEDREALQEFLSFIESGTPGKALLRMTDPANRTFCFEARGQLEKAGAGDGTTLLKVDLVEMDADQWNKLLVAAQTGGGTAPTAKDPGAFRFEAIVIDGAFLKPDPATWYEQFVELMRATKVLGPDDQPPKILVMSDPKSNARLNDFRIKGITDFSYKPFDRRYFIQKLQAFVPALAQVREQETSPWVPSEFLAKLGKEVVMDEIAEYGLVIQHPSAFRERSFMRFFSNLFGEEGSWISGRCHSCEKVPDKEIFRCNFMFFGPADDLLQRIRRWIREDYVAKKDGKS